MKTHRTLLLVVPLIFSGCGPVAPSATSTNPAPHPGLPAGHKPYDGPHQATYQLGMNQGQADAQAGRSRQPSRHYGDFPATQTDAFNRGYQAGYSLATRPQTPPAANAPVPPVPPGPAGRVVPPATSADGPLTASRSPGKVTLSRGSRVVTTCHTAMPNVEKARFHDGQARIVIKSRADHGPATLQFFDTATGKEIAQVMAHQVQGGWPSWAVGMGE